jgi:hypothetical protein
VKEPGRGEVSFGLYSLQDERARPIGAPARRLSHAAARDESLGVERVCLPASLLGATVLPPPASVAGALARSVARAPRIVGGPVLRALYSRPSAAEEKLGAP